MYLLKYISFVALFFLTACSGGDTAKVCAGGEPKALFSKDMRGVSNYSFSSDGTNSTEKLSLPELAYELEILESGCEHKTQEIRFTALPYNGQLDEVANAAECALFFGESMFNISEIAPQKLLTLKSWGQAIAKQSRKMQYNVPVPIEGEPFTIQMDKMQQPQSILVTVIIKEL